MEKLTSLINLRTAASMSLVDLGAKIGKSKQYMWGLENGKIRLSYNTAVELAAVFGKTPDIFLPGGSISNLPNSGSDG